MKVVNLIRRIVFFILILLLCTIGITIWLGIDSYEAADEANQALKQYKPEDTIDNTKVVNSSILDLQKINPDVCGWITLDDTEIDYPYVLSKDNQDYLDKDLEGDYIPSGTIFADCRCSKDSGDIVTLLYGHNMKDGTMFADLTKFSLKKFWNNHKTGSLYLPHVTYNLEILAYLVVDAADETIYTPDIETEKEAEALYTYIKEKAIRFREPTYDWEGKVLILSTCSYQFTGARTVIVAKMTPKVNQSN